jgi:FlaA1/EpsC-like NDP-sugar epimerase
MLNNDILLPIIGRDSRLLSDDLNDFSLKIKAIVSDSRFLVLGGAGSIGQAVVKSIFKHDPIKLHVVDISENGLVELVRDIRSEYGYINGEFKTLALDIGSLEYDSFIDSDGHYDYVLNLSALKHVRSEKDPYTLMRMINVNIFNTDKTILQSIKSGVKKYFCVSTDKATNPVNMMGASKRIMEMFIMRRSENIEISTARFANVAFSDGSLLYSFEKRIEKNQPIVAPDDVERYFITPEESGELCLLSALFGCNRDVFFPKLTDSFKLTTFSKIAESYLRYKGYEPYLCETEDEARNLAKSLPQKGLWPCLFAASDTTGEKAFEEFYTGKETIDSKTFKNIGVIKNTLQYDNDVIINFEKSIESMKINNNWDKESLVKLFLRTIPNFNHVEMGKFLDGKM